MKKIPFILGLALLTISINAQTKAHKLGLTFGGGSEKYRGDLGNGFTLKNNTWYGGFNLSAAYYMNRSFDVGISGWMGDYGYCQPKENTFVAVDADDRCPGCVGRVGLGNLSSRMTSGGVFAKYKFANGYLLKETSKIQPYVSLGASYNNLTDRMKMNCVNEGNYYAINTSVGAKYYLTQRLNVGYNLTVGCFTTDHIDRIMKGEKSDMYAQNTLVIGFDF
jgi:hypothetical protein